MELVKQTKEFSIFKKRSGRYGVKNTNNKWINGDDKKNILVAEGLVKVTAAKAPEAAVEEEAPAAEAAE